MFRQLALARERSVSAYLGLLVAAELKRRKATAMENVEAHAPEADQAVAALAEVGGAIAELDDIAGRLARSATAHGASWEDVGSSLRVSRDAAEASYGARRGGRQ